ncbi:UdgX family uracil-DNA binding protein [Variovorax sp. J22P240]|uniref:UdgX family uracil-DNA binding protein n=1 Tax=Variovorax sp. J22P240 TaxID=3053514 RepID=UPI0025773E50|nr:UdgX family uracil-DNA binding protein [Variovorax sp. J22P240]MDM0001186.1 UdgX family uracil-DNA binding protein [Variovorax sp. J22P240]
MLISLIIPAPDDLPGIFAALRGALHHGFNPDAVRWDDGRVRQSSWIDDPLQGSHGGAPCEFDLHGRLPAEASRAPHTDPAAPPVRLPRAFIELLRSALLHDSPERFHAAHTLAAAILRDRRAWNDTLRDDRLRLERMAREVRREVHKMHAFARFRPLLDEAGECHVAWFEPAHHVVRAAAPFFVDRFASMRWAILTPRGSVHWDRHALRFGPPATREDAPGPDEGEGLWLAYYRSVFNPARLKPAMMRREMPVRFWRNLPEASQITSLMQQADQRAHGMETRVSPARERRAGRTVPLPGDGCHEGVQPSCGGPQAGQVAEPLPASPSQRLASLAHQASCCEECDFAADATETVWGEGRAGATLMLVGEQPGDQEDLAGRPFVGPAGQLLRRAIRALQWPQEELYFTNAIKHFKYEWRGKRRIHKTAAQREASACAHWLEAEIATVRPRALVALGRTALASLLQEAVSIEAHAGRWLTRASDGLPVYVMPHPAAVLRAGSDSLPRREAEWTALLAGAGDALRALRAAPTGT